jgi:Salmonella virulence plasmid 65kDa B protein
MHAMNRRDRHVYRALKRFLTQALLYVLIAQIIVLPVARHAPVARAEPNSGTAAYVSEDNEGFNFSEQSSTLTEAAAQTTRSNALKVRKAPVDASGMYTTSVSIDLPPGRAGMTPGLSLSYASGSARRDSPVGAGWNLWGDAPAAVEPRVATTRAI